MDTPQEEPEVQEPELHILSRAEILQAERNPDGTPAIPTQVVPVPEWSGSVIVRGLTGVGRDAFEASLVKRRGRKTEENLTNFRAKLVAQTVVDEGGRLLFKEADIPALGEKSAIALERVYEVAQKLSRLTAADVEELTEDLGEDQSGDSGSGLPLTSGTEASDTPNETSTQTSTPNG